MSDVNAADLGDMEVAYSEYANRIWGGRHFASCREFDRAIAKVKADAWGEGWYAGYTDAVNDEHPQATGRHEPNPYEIEGAINHE